MRRLSSSSTIRIWISSIWFSPMGFSSGLRCRYFNDHFREFIHHRIHPQDTVVVLDDAIADAETEP
jgi:hypothetical protein